MIEEELLMKFYKQWQNSFDCKRRWAINLNKIFSLIIHKEAIRQYT